MLFAIRDVTKNGERLDCGCFSTGPAGFGELVFQTCDGFVPDIIDRFVLGHAGWPSKREGERRFHALCSLRALHPSPHDPVIADRDADNQQPWTVSPIGHTARARKYRKWAQMV
jgi:hypothetical protein